MNSNDEKKIKNKNSSEIHSNFFIKIDGKNKLEGEHDDVYSQLLMESVNSIAMENMDDMGKEINKFFIKILPENKEGDTLKFNYLLSSKIKKKLGLHTEQIKAKCEDYMNQIINMKIDPSSPFALTRDINEKLSLVLMLIFKNIKKYGKFADYEEVKENILKSVKYQNGILDELRNKNESNPYSYMYSNDSYIDDNDFLYDTGKKTMANFQFDKNVNVEPFRMSLAVKSNRSEIMSLNNSLNNIYNYKGETSQNITRIPREVFILREKFENIKTIKLSLKRQNTSNNDELLLLDQSDIIYNIFVLINLQLLFQNLIGIELDLSNELILKDEIKDINPKYEKVLKKAKKNRKITFYKTENKIRVYDIYKNRNLTMTNNKNNTEDIESSDTFSTFHINNINIINTDESKKKQEQFLNKHMYSLQMIVIYWYFITKLKNITICNFTVPINFEDKILSMLKENKTIAFDFNIFTNLTDKVSEVTLDFNSLDNKLFLQIISFLFKNSQITKCHLSFFPPEEYFEPRHLFYLLKKSLKARIKTKEIFPGEEIETFILRKLSESFEVNINKLFCYFLNTPKLREISLIFDIPPILNKVSNYEMVVIKLIINFFLYLNKTKIPKTFKKIAILSDNLNFDNRKYTFLSDFLDNLNIYKMESLQIEGLCLKCKIIDIHNIYRLIPYNLAYLSLGSFDLISFQYFVEYITSAEFSVHSQLKYLQISLSNSILIMDDQCFQALEKLLIYYPKNLEEININTSLFATSAQIEKLLINTNYNKIRTIRFYYNNNESKMFKTPNKKENEESIESIMELYYIKTDDEVYPKFKKQTLNIMYKFGNKFNTDFMDFNIFSQLEKFLCNKGKKTIIFQ